MCAGFFGTLLCFSIISASFALTSPTFQPRPCKPPNRLKKKVQRQRCRYRPGCELSIQLEQGKPELAAHTGTRHVFWYVSYYL